MTQPNENPFERDALVDEPGIVGARWWHKGLQAQAQQEVSRRGALVALGAIGAVLACGVGMAVAGDDYDEADRSSLEMQRMYGWDFGAPNEALVFDGVQYLPFTPQQFLTLASDLQPQRHVSLHSPTLVQSVTATPTQRPGEDSSPFRPLPTVLRPLFTATMDAAYKQGTALATLFQNRGNDVALLLDMQGPDSVAFAAGASTVFEPVHLFENWPHPRGVVLSHRTLGAMVYYQPLFAGRAPQRGSTAPPMFLLDRGRFVAYTDESERFDNRFIARVPSAAALRAAGVSKLLYVVSSEYELPEFDDLNDQLVELAAAGISVRAVLASSFFDGGQGQLFYGGFDYTHEGFWVDYPWAEHSPSAASPESIAPRAKSYTPVRRVTQFLRGQTSLRLGMVPVVLAAGTGAVLGARFFRAGSWHRSAGGWGG